MAIDKLDRFLEDVGYSLSGSEIPDNRLWRNTAQARVQYPEKTVALWQNNARLIQEVIGTTMEAAITGGIVGKGIPIPSGELSHYAVVSGYGWRLNPGPRHHHGVDISPKSGASLRLVAGLTGIVVQKSTNVPGYGNVLAIKSNDSINGRSVILYYAHLASFAQGIEPGRLVKQGQEVAVMGRTGGSYPVHLHYEVRLGVNDKTATVNPALAFTDLRTKLAYSKGSVTEYANYQKLAAAHPLDTGPKSNHELA